MEATSVGCPPWLTRPLSFFFFRHSSHLGFPVGHLFGPEASHREVMAKRLFLGQEDRFPICKHKVKSLSVELLSRWTWGSLRWCGEGEGLSLEAVSSVVKGSDFANIRVKTCCPTTLLSVLEAVKTDSGLVFVNVKIPSIKRQNIPESFPEDLSVFLLNMTSFSQYPKTKEGCAV